MTSHLANGTGKLTYTKQPRGSSLTVARESDYLMFVHFSYFLPIEEPRHVTSYSSTWFESERVYSHRVVGRDCDHRDPDRTTPARGPEDPRGGQSHEVYQ